MTPAEREILQAVKDLSVQVKALHTAFDELTLVPPTETEILEAIPDDPDPMEQHRTFVANARRNYEARNPGGRSNG